MIICGIDPGKTGALALLRQDDTTVILDVPLIKLRGKERPSWAEWSNMWIFTLENIPPQLIVIEDISARPGQGVTSMFTFGRTLGFAHALAAHLEVPIHFVTPNVWKGKLGLLNSDKGASRDKARTLFPKSADKFARVKDDGRAEAALLAYYGRKYLA